MELWFILAIVAIFAVSILVYVFLMLFFPEWVGITGKVALAAERSHRDENSEESADQKVDAASSDKSPK